MPDSDPPVVRVARGEPTTEELAALVTVLATRSGSAAGPPARPTGPGWADRAALHRRPLHPGPGAWHGSARLR